MKIKSLLLCNAGFKIGTQRITLPASPAVIELDDNLFKPFVARLDKLVKEGGAEWVKKPTLTKEEQAKLKAEELAKAEALVAANKKSA